MPNLGPSTQKLAVKNSTRLQMLTRLRLSDCHANKSYYSLRTIVSQINPTHHAKHQENHQRNKKKLLCI
jgi:hypothetical protein